MSSSAVQPLLALLAHPVGGNPMQYMIEKAFAHHDLDWRYLTFEVASENLGDAVRGLRALGFRGGHCANPHRQAVIPLLDRTTEAAELAGTVDLIFRQDEALVGENTEGKGIVSAIRRVSDPAGKRVVLLGSGGVARAVAVELASARAAGLTIVDPAEAQAAELAALLAGKFATPVAAAPWPDAYEVPLEAEVLIHAASLGNEAGEKPLPLVPDSLRPELLVADATFDPRRALLLGEASQHGCATVDGLSMFIEQVAIGFRLWTDVDPDRQVLREAVEEFLEL